MRRHHFTPRLDTLEARLPPSAIVISGGTPQAPAERAAIDPTDPVDMPPAPPPQYPVEYPTPPHDPFAPVIA